MCFEKFPYTASKHALRGDFTDGKLNSSVQKPDELPLVVWRQRRNAVTLHTTEFTELIQAHVSNTATWLN
jgi:hypothetical protein